MKYDGTTYLREVKISENYYFDAEFVVQPVNFAKNERYLDVFANEETTIVVGIKKGKEVWLRFIDDI